MGSRSPWPTSATPRDRRRRRCAMRAFRRRSKAARATRSRHSTSCRPIWNSVVSAPALPDAEGVLAALVERMSAEVAADALLVGIYSGGAWLAERLGAALAGEHPVGFIDVSFYRDDYATKGLRAKVERTALPFDIAGKRLVLVDDVLYSGRFGRAAVKEHF